jgi:hypothetical protein
VCAFSVCWCVVGCAAVGGTSKGVSEGQAGYDHLLRDAGTPSTGVSAVQHSTEEDRTAQYSTAECSTEQYITLRWQHTADHHMQLTLHIQHSSAVHNNAQHFCCCYFCCWLLLLLLLLLLPLTFKAENMLSCDCVTVILYACVLCMRVLPPLSHQDNAPVGRRELCDGRPLEYGAHL